MYIGRLELDEIWGRNDGTWDAIYKGDVTSNYHMESIEYQQFLREYVFSIISQLSKKTLLFLCLIIFSLGAACSNKNITEEFSNTTWESSDKLLALRFTNDSLSVDMNIKPDIDETEDKHDNVFKKK